jgi:hypothetical protein
MVTVALKCVFVGWEFAPIIFPLPTPAPNPLQLLNPILLNIVPTVIRRIGTHTATPLAGTCHKR